MLRDPKLAALMVPPIQADLEVIETWTYESGEPLPVSITACGGSRDSTAGLAVLKAWREQTPEAFTLQMLNGGYFYLLDDPQPLLRILGDTLQGVQR